MDVRRASALVLDGSEILHQSAEQRVPQKGLEERVDGGVEIFHDGERVVQCGLHALLRVVVLRFEVGDVYFHSGVAESQRRTLLSRVQGQIDHWEPEPYDRRLNMLNFLASEPRALDPIRDTACRRDFTAGFSRGWWSFARCAAWSRSSVVREFSSPSVSPQCLLFVWIAPPTMVC
jgi:hypothetical protein